jgi:CubicO group peptidase (beta-lactamase class C family)
MKFHGTRVPLLPLGLALSLALIAGAAAALAQGLPVTRPERAGMSSERLDRIRDAFQEYIDAGKLPGAITAVARGGRLVHFETLGLMDVEAGKEMRPDAIVRIYSMTKPVTGVAVMILFEEGRFLLNDPISKYLPEFETMSVYLGGTIDDPRTEPARPMTIKHLLTHTSGLTYGSHMKGSTSIYRKVDLWKAPNLQEFVARLASAPLAAQPGTEWNYGVSMDVLGRFVEVLSGQPFDRFLNERIFRPLGMVDTGFHVPDDKLDRFAASYGPAGPDGGLKLLDAPRESPYRNPERVPHGGSGLVSTASDYLRFAQMLTNFGELEGVRILGRKTVELMMTNHLDPELGPGPLGEAAGWYQTDPRGLGFGLSGAVVTDVARGSLPGSAGSFFWGGNASTFFWVDPSERLVGLILTQLEPSSTYPIRGLIRILTYPALID